jgi:hypothetical protein
MSNRLAEARTAALITAIIDSTSEGNVLDAQTCVCRLLGTISVIAERFSTTDKIYCGEALHALGESIERGGR